MKKLNDQTRKEDVVTFEQLGVDRLFVDESHSFKNLFLYTKMRNVAGISQTDAQKSYYIILSGLVIEFLHPRLQTLLCFFQLLDGIWMN